MLRGMQHVFKFYLSGPIGQRSRTQIDAWRAVMRHMVKQLDHEVVDFVIDPPRGRQRTPEEIVAADLALLAQCDAMIAYCDDKTSAGSAMEIFHMAHNLKRPVYVIDATRSETGLAKWIRAHATRVYSCSVHEGRRAGGSSAHRDFVRRATAMAVENMTCREVARPLLEGLARAMPPECCVSNGGELTPEAVKRLDEYVKNNPGTWHKFLIVEDSERKDLLADMLALPRDTIYKALEALPLPEGTGVNDHHGTFYAGFLSNHISGWAGPFKNRATAVFALWADYAERRARALEAGAVL